VSKRPEAKAAVEEAARKAARHAVSRGNRRVLFWTIASIIGMFAAANLKLYLLKSVGVADPSRTMEVLATGLIIGSGTQPLHSLVELISAKKDATEAGATP
jgi:hypothetical protein